MRTVNRLLVGFGALGLFLAALGIYGVIARIVVQRTGEIGIRMALGAQMRDVIRLILGSGLRMVLVGAGLGLLGAVALVRFLGSLMPALVTSNAVALAVATAALMAMALLACYLPARRAARIDPLEALRAE
jgi:ABC-type antimicrobial peptide transport system permease subunit